MEVGLGLGWPARNLQMTALCHRKEESNCYSNDCTVVIRRYYPAQ